jgi:hypothetical protein
MHKEEWHACQNTYSSATMPSPPWHAVSVTTDAWYPDLTCGPIQTNPNVLVSSDTLAYGDVARLSCAMGYMYVWRIRLSLALF